MCSRSWTDIWSDGNETPLLPAATGGGASPRLGAGESEMLTMRNCIAILGIHAAKHVYNHDALCLNLMLWSD